jgi:hypothetical protein
MSRLLMLSAVLLVVGCSGAPAFRIDPTQPFRIEFGRGSGLFGLNTIRIEQDGSVVLHREKGQITGPNDWETATLTLPPDQLKEVLKAVESTGVMGLDRAYHDAKIHDGTQWVFWVRQGEREKSVYFNNKFPAAIRRFAEQLDGILIQAGAGGVAWQPVPAADARKHERELWGSISK